MAIFRIESHSGSLKRWFEMDQVRYNQLVTQRHAVYCYKNIRQSFCKFFLVGVYFKTDLKEEMSHIGVWVYSKRRYDFNSAPSKPLNMSYSGTFAFVCFRNAKRQTRPPK